MHENRNSVAPKTRSGSFHNARNGALLSEEVKNLPRDLNNQVVEERAKALDDRVDDILDDAGRRP